MGETFDENLVRSWARAFAAFAKARNDGAIVIGRDTRSSGEWALKLAAEEIQKLGTDVVSVGVAPTPTIELAITHHKAAGGMIITASHNPIEWNGLKFLGSDGVFLDESEVNELQSLVGKDVNPAENPGEFAEDQEAILRHIENVLTNLPIDIEKIKQRKFKVVVDPVNGTGALAIPPLLEKLGCEVVMINGIADGNFGHAPEPRPENLIGLSEKVREIKADIGLAIDPDADRLALVDNKGTAISEEYTLALAVFSILKNNPRNKVAVNLSTSRMIDDIAKQFESEVVRTPVGERHVVEGMRKNQAIIGGEGNGGVIFSKSHEGRDSLVGAPLILNLLASANKTILEIISSLPRYAMTKEKFPRTGDFNKEEILARLKNAFPNAEVSNIDGVRLDFPGGWLHVRPSNTEPIVRIITEAKNENVLQKMVEKARKALG